MRIAFYAPLKSPHHPTPSGDRSMARLLIKALEAGGHEVEVISELRSLETAGSREAQISIEHDAAQERVQLKELPSSRANGRAEYDLWFTYHHYYKAPDFLGFELARHWGIPYLLAEASHAPKRLVGPWADWARFTEAGIREADKVLYMTGFDRVCLEPLVVTENLISFPPFLDAKPFLDRPVTRSRTPDLTRLLSVAMMRPGDKVESYRRLAHSLERLKDWSWHLTIAGDGPDRSMVEGLFQALPEEKVAFIGAVEPGDLPALYAEADLFLWPGAGEAYGMVYLEAAASGLGVLAQNIRGVPDVVIDGSTGILTPDDDQTAYANALLSLLEHPEKQAAMGEAGREFVSTERDLPRAAARLNRLFQEMGLGQ